MKTYDFFPVRQSFLAGAFSLLFLLCHVSADAGEYKPMLKDGRLWKCIEVYLGEEKNDTLAREYRIDGKSEIDGRTCYSLCLGSKVIDYYYEEGPQVFHHTSQGWELLFDFSLSPGEGAPNSGGLTVEEVKPIVMKGVSRRCVFFPIATDDGEKVCWIEGIGSSYSGPYIQFTVPGTLLGKKLLSVYDGDACIFEAEDLVPNANVNTIDLVTEGKQWKEHQETIGRTRYEFTYTISGDTVIAGEEYHKLFIEYIIYDLSKETGNPEVFFTQPRTFFAGLQQRDGRVYIHQYDKKRLLYDFTLKEGDIAFEDATHVQRVTKVDTILVNGSLRRRLFLAETWKGVEQVVEETGCWVEGIGGSRGLEHPHDWFAIGGEHRLTECIEDGTCIFTAADFSAPAYWQGSINAIKTVIKPDSENTTITYDLQGRRVTGSPRPGIYIQNGRKHVMKR